MFLNSKDEEKWISLIFHLYNLNNLEYAFAACLFIGKGKRTTYFRTYT